MGTPLELPFLAQNEDWLSSESFGIQLAEGITSLMRKRITSQTIHQVEQSIGWARELQYTLKELSRTGEVDPISPIIARSVSRWAWLPTCILALSCCRFADLEQVRLIDILEGNAQSVMQEKTGTIRELPNLFLLNSGEKSALVPTANVMNTEYDALRLAITKATPYAVREALINQHDKTHIFRHLRASWFHAKGKPITEIRDFFKHKSAEATRSYIHESIFSDVLPNQ